MPFQTNWFIPDRVLHVRFSGNLTTEEILDSAEAITKLSNASESPIFLIIDSHSVTKLPLNFQSALQMLGKFRGNTNIAWTIVVSENSLYRYFNAIVSKVVHTPTRTFATLEDAYKFIAYNAPELAAELADNRENLLVS